MTGTDPYEVYSEIAESYAESNPEQAARANYEWPAVRDTLPTIDGKTVLDAGCGSGYYSAWLADQGATVVGIDASEEMLTEARTRHGHAAEFQQVDLREPLPFDDASFDLVVSQLTLEHIEDWDSVTAEFARILDDLGEVVASMDHPFTTYFVIDQEPPDIGSANSQAANYYEIERYERDWGDVSMPVYRRSLREIVAPFFDAGFVLTDLREPRPEPVIELHEYFKENTPRFLVLRAQKR